jgi:hydrogenase small subunit
MKKLQEKDMHGITRRDFLTLSAKLAVLTGLSASAVPKIAQAIEELASNTAPVLWLQAQSCSGCSVSLLNSQNPGPAEILTRYLSLLFHSTLSTATGETAMDVLNRSIETGGYLLVVEGSIPEKMPDACVMGKEPLTQQVARAAKNATAVVAVGTCAAFGGIPAAENNPTGAVDVPAFLSHERITTPVIRLPGCPVHPDWIVGTLAHLLKFGMPPLDDKQRPKAFFSKLVHEQCPRFRDYEREFFAETFSDDGCLFKLGCTGTNTYADCTLRHWNSNTNSCINAGAPCIGCASEAFAKMTSFPFYRKGEHL